MPYNWNHFNRKNQLNRADHEGAHRVAFERNKKKILASQDICALCGKPVDKTLKYPHPFSATIDHIIPISKGGHPSALENLQLAHFSCNRFKGDNLKIEKQAAQKKKSVTTWDDTDSRGLPWSIDWSRFGTEDQKNLAEEADKLKKRGLVLTARGVFSKLNIDE